MTTFAERQDDTSTMLDDCMSRQEKLSEWEQQFVDSLSHQLSRGRSLTDKQLSRLGAIWERVT